MSRASAKVLSEALSLTREERMELAAELLASVDGDADPGWEQAWLAEVDRRASASDSRGAPPPEWKDVRARVMAKLAHK